MLRQLSNGLFALVAVAAVAFTAAACEDTRPNGASCLKASDCESGFCRGGVCVAEPINTEATSVTASSSSTGGAGGMGGGNAGGAGGEGGSAGGGGGTAGAGGVGGMGGAGGAGGS